METQALQNYRNMENDPYYFCHFLNMGHHNVYLILTYIYNSIYGDYPSSTDEVIEDICSSIARKSRKNPDEKVKIMKLLIYHFPFLACYNIPEAQCDIIKIFLNEYLVPLHSLRNRFSHYKHPIQDIHIEKYQEVFDQAKIDAQSRMKYCDEDIKKVVSDIETPNGVLTERGILFFICLFLDKKNAYLFLSKIKGFKDRNKRPGEMFKSATLEVFSQYYCHVPYPKLESNDITLDILNELNRCPKALFNVLDDDNKVKFIIDRSDEEENSKDELSDTNEESEEPLSIMKRSDDRFPYFTLQYFEKSQCLDNISFQLYLGRKYTKPAHEKEINGEKRTHEILKDIHIFGELSYYRRNDITNIIKSRKDIEFYAPSYHIVGNRISIILRNEKDIPFSALEKGKIGKKDDCPDAILSTHELSALFFYNYLYKKGWIDTAPSEYISNYISRFKRFIADVQENLFTCVADQHDFLKKRIHDGSETEKLERRKMELQTKLNKYKLKIEWIPDACREYLLGYKSKKEAFFIKGKFQRMRADTDHKIKKIEFIQQESSENIVHKQIRIGELAQELARDIIFFIPPHKNKCDKDSKINNMEFNILQKMLAYFPLYKDKIYTFLMDIKNWGKHPFLRYVLKSKCTSLLAFYKEYLRCKKIWISRYLSYDPNTRKSSLKDDTYKIKKAYEYFLKMGAIKEVQEKEYFDNPLKPVYLPTNLFMESIIKAMQQNGYDISDNSNIAGCLKIYYEDKIQPMYSLPHYYVYDDEISRRLLPRDELKQLIRTYFENSNRSKEMDRPMKRTAKGIRENETAILIQQQNDRALFLMANELSINMFQKEDIENLGFDAHYNILEKEYDMQQQIYGRNVTARLPIKRYGEFRRFLKDRRIENLIKYYPQGQDIPSGIPESGKTLKKDEKYTFSNLYNELEIYDNERDNILKLIYETDKELIDHFPDEIVKEKGYYEHYNCLTFAKERFGLDKDVDALSLNDFDILRNNLYHNQIPYNKWIEDKINEMTEDPMIVRRILSLIKDIYEHLLKDIRFKIEEYERKSK